jgi:tetratricopeptide (TPR) repeat protein
MGENAMTRPPTSSPASYSSLAPAGTASSDPAGTLRWLGVALVFGSLLTRATVPTTNLPAWDSDPTYFSIITPGLGPAGSMLIDAIALAGTAAMLAGEAVAGRRVRIGWVLGAAIASVVALLHGWWWQAIGSAAAHGTLGNQRIGMAWVSGVWSAIAVLHAARDPLVRRTFTGVLLALVTLLALRGAQQVFVDHPITVAAFNADRDRWLASKGWTPGSPSALAYIRRMNQPEATGWFGLSNVVASFGGLGVAIAGAWLWSVMAAGRGGESARNDGRDRVPRGQLIVATGTLVASLATVYLAGSKGGVVVALIAGLLAALGMIAAQSPRLAKLGRLLGPVCIFGVLAAVAARGLVGERIGELSILFRWFYMQAAVRIFGAHPLTGVGPDGFQLAYLTAKNPLNPEEVTSPHSILLDWTSTLGVWGLAWAAVLVAMGILAGRALVGDHEERVPAAGDARRARQVGMLVLAGATIAASWVESPYITPDSALVRVVGLLIGCGLVHATVTAPFDRALRIGLAAGALAMLAHAQIELTGSNFATAGLFLCTLATAAGGASSVLAPTTSGSPLAARAHRTVPALAAAGCALLAGFVMVRGSLPARAWENDLKAAASVVTPLADIGERFAALHRTKPLPGERREDPAKFFDDVSKLLGRKVAATQAGWDDAAAALDAKFLPAAAALLERAQSRYPDDWRVGREAGRLYLRLREPVRGDPKLASEYSVKAISAIPLCVPSADTERAVVNAPRTRAIAMVYETMAGGQPGPELEAAVRALEVAQASDPYNLDIAMKLFRLNRTLNRPDASSRWAAKALKLDAFSRLDRETRGLSSQERAEVESAAKSGGSNRPAGPPP